MNIDTTITIGVFVNVVILFVSVFNSWQHMNTKNKILELELRIQRNFVSNRVCEERRGILPKGECEG